MGLDHGIFADILKNNEAYKRTRLVVAWRNECHLLYFIENILNIEIKNGEKYQLTRENLKHLIKKCEEELLGESKEFSTITFNDEVNIMIPYSKNKERCYLIDPDEYDFCLERACRKLKEIYIDNNYSNFKYQAWF